MKTTKTTDTRSRVVHGGCWFLTDDAAWVRAAIRYGGVPSNRDGDLGFRCTLRVREPVGVKP